MEDHRDVRRSEAPGRIHRDAQWPARALLARPASVSLVLPNMAQSVNITELNLPQLEMLKNQLDQEVEFLSTSIAQLKVVQTKYVEAKDCLNVLNKNNEAVMEMMSQKIQQLTALGAAQATAKA
uniref:Prefoldin subunit 5 n=1 Tax=Suricata suricatta TaxID=37032 RepID=A0A673UBB6_SURSU